jgi:hypothetical protein
MDGIVHTAKAAKTAKTAKTAKNTSQLSSIDQTHPSTPISNEICAADYTMTEAKGALDEDIVMTEPMGQL